MRSPRHSASSKASSELLQQGYRYALSLTHHDARAQDILQDACVALLRSAGPWNRGYLFRTIRNRFIDLYRRELLAPVELMENAGSAPDRLENALGGEAIVADAEFLEKALASLRTEEREALFLAAVEGYTTAEIAELTGRPRGTVLSLVFRARRKIERLARPREAKGER